MFLPKRKYIRGRLTISSKETWYDKKSTKKYDIGDIVFVNEYNYNENKIGDNHLFVIIDDDNQIIPLEYFGLIVSSHIEKSKENSNYRYNETLRMSTINSLKSDSIVKCDKLYEISPSNIQFKIGTVDVDDFVRFINAYDDFINETDKAIEKETSNC